MGADYSRVTHPCAALLRAEAPFTLDLHVLGLPPAFVLSQDQTLQFDSLFLQRRLLSAANFFFRDVPSNVFTRSASPAVSFLGSHFCLFLSLLRFSNLLSGCCSSQPARAAYTRVTELCQIIFYVFFPGRIRYAYAPGYCYR